MKFHLIIKKQIICWCFLKGGFEMKKYRIVLFLLLLVVIVVGALHRTKGDKVFGEDFSDIRTDIACDVFEYISEKEGLDIHKPDKLPEGYAGAYLDDDGSLVLCVTEKGVSLFDDVLGQISYEDIFQDFALVADKQKEAIKKNLVRISVRQFSLEELSNILEALWEVMEKYEITEAGLIQRRNRIEIYVKSEEVITEIKAYLREVIENFDEKSVYFIVSDITIEVTANHMYGGKKI